MRHLYWGQMRHYYLGPTRKKSSLLIMLTARFACVRGGLRCSYWQYHCDELAYVLENASPKYSAKADAAKGGELAANGDI